MLEKTLRSFKFSPETKARIKELIEEFELLKKVESITAPKKAIIGIKGQDRGLINEIYLTFIF